jgi:hypothetical protein
VVEISPWDLNVPEDARDYIRLMAKLGCIDITEAERQALPDAEVLSLAKVLFMEYQPPEADEKVRH